MATTATTCGACGTPVEGSDFLYNAQGQPMCRACADKADLANTDQAAANNIVKAGWGALGSGVLAFAGGMFFLGIITYLFVAGSIVSAVLCLNRLYMGNDERFTKLLTSGQRTTATLCAVAGVILSALTTLGIATQLGLQLALSR